MAILAVAALTSATACGDDDGDPDPTPDTGSESGDGVVSQQEAEQAALDFIGEGEVTFVSEEDDRGAAWEIEITRPDGSEVDVLIAPDGSVIDGGSDATGDPDATPDTGSESGDGVVSQQEAEQAALDFIGEGEVTFVSEEDDRGAAWEIEITRPDGSEVDVLIAPDGSVIN